MPRGSANKNKKATLTEKSVQYSMLKSKLPVISKRVNYLPLKEEYFNDKGVMIRRMTTAKIETIEGITTVLERKMENLKKGSHTIVSFSSIDYNTGLTSDLFTERFLKNPPRKYIK